MAYTANVQSGTTIQKEVKSLTFSTVTGGATETIVFNSYSMLAPEIQQTAITTANAHSEVGQQVGMTQTIDFTVIGLGAVADWTALNELKDQSNRCSYVKIEYIGGETETWDSGSDDLAIVYISVNYNNNVNESTVSASVHCERIISNIDKSIS